MKKILDAFKNSPRVTIILVAVNILLLHWLSYGLYFRFDISQAGNMRITKASKKILRQLPSPLTIEAYFSEDVPVAYIQAAKTVKDFLREYASAGGDNVRLIFIDPDKNPENRMRAQNLGIAPMAMGSIGQKKQEISNVYFSVVLLYQDKNQVLPNILSTGMLEYQITARSYAMAYPQEQGIGLVSGGGFRLYNQENPVQGLSAMDEIVSNFYGHIQPLQITQGAIPAQIKTLLLVQPRNLSNEELYSIDQFLLQGNNVILTASGMDIDFQNQLATETPNLNAEFWQNYGVTIEKNMLNEGKEILSLRQPPANAGIPAQEIPMPVWMLLPPKNLSSDSVITQNIPNLFAPWASSLQLHPQNFPTRGQEDSTEEKSPPIILAQTTKNSWAQTGMVSIAPAAQRDVYFNSRAGLLKNETFASQPVAVYLQGYFKSYFAGKEILATGSAHLDRSAREGRLMVFSTPYALSDLGIMQSSNAFFLLNALDAMNGLQDLVKARSNGEENPRLPMLPNWVKQTVTAVSFLFPFLLVTAGGIFYLRRRKGLAQLPYGRENTTN